jgi:PAS domain S-box-containing protein
LGRCTIEIHEPWFSRGPSHPSDLPRNERCAGRQLEIRKAFLEFGERDARVLAEVGPALGTGRGRFVDRFYAHLLRFPETQALLADPATLERLRQAQARYFDRLFAGDYGLDYAEDRARVGAAYHRIGLEVQWYLGAYALYLRWLLPEVWRAAGGEWSRALPVLEAIIKVVFLDMGIAIETYHASEQRRIFDLKRQYERIFQSVPAGLLVVDPELKLVAANRSFLESCGCAREDLLRRSVSEVLGAAEVERPLRETLATGTPVSGLHFIARCPSSGASRPVRIAVTGIELAEEEEEEEALLLVVEDLSGEERLAALVRSSERRFEEVIEHATDGMVLMDRDGRLSYVNRSAEKMFGWPRAELIGKPLAVLIPERRRREWEEDLARSLAPGEGPVLGGVQPLEGLRRDGSVFPLECSVSVYREEGDVVVLAVLRDVTEQRALTANLMQVDRMVAVGTLAAGVAHELNNPLAYVITNLELLASELPEVFAAVHGAAAGQRLAELEHALAEAREGAERVRKIVRDLRVFSRAEEDRREPVALARVLESAVNMAWNELRHRARLVKDFGPTPLVEANESRLGQVFLNLLVNAAHAIPEGNVEANEIRLVARTDERGYAVVEVRDTGYGIPADVLPRIFDPFFTTKPVGQGTGLGLSICRNIVHGFGGTIDVRSTVDQGTVVCVTLPPARLDAVPAAPPEQRAVPPGRRGRILVVDDEPLVGGALRRVLEREHEAVAVTTGREALERLARERFDLVLCDLMMPEMTGMDFYAEVGRRFPDLAPRVVFLTGGAFTPRAREFLDRVPNERLEKPVDVQNLLALVRNLLR